MRKLLLLAVPAARARLVRRRAGVARQGGRQDGGLSQGRLEVPARVIAVGSKQLKTYTANQADIIPAPAACPKALLSRRRRPARASLDHRERCSASPSSPTRPTPDGKGTATFRLRQGEGQVCYSLSVSSIGARDGCAHPQGQRPTRSGPVVRPARRRRTRPGASSGCAKVASRVDRQRHPQDAVDVLRERAQRGLRGRRDPRPAPAADEHLDPRRLADDRREREAERRRRRTAPGRARS